ncbi:ABC transporter permease [Mechercharimyces sp. CAU 1602]|uniref:ABC transporter permease n=1 Tax=Mechercharimyces sp. CAU 1602 TaxID=2973933 RepID=UPI002163F17C|nr:ABC transporter permease [Mechercharimyces sp. CAU 1602]MCS1350533.1 ABC transporter permease [Mechercharimyces sp. CAU 1602]
MVRRVLYLVWKEFIQLRRDRRTLAMMLLLPLIWLIAFGYAVRFDIEEIHVMVVDEAKNEASKDVIEQLEEYEDLIVDEIVPVATAERALEEGRTDVIVTLPNGFRSFPAEKEQKLTLQVDGSRLFTAQSAVRSTSQFLYELQQENMTELKEELVKILAKSPSPSLELTQVEQLQPLLGLLTDAQIEQVEEGLNEEIEKGIASQTEKRAKTIEDWFPDFKQLEPEVDVLYNPDLKSVNYMLPGLVGLILIFITTLMTSLGVVKEKERGTLEQLIVSPLSSLELILGKLLPYILIAFIDFLLVFVAGVVIFAVPFHGPFFSFMVVALLFLIGSLGLGLLISTVSQNQQQAMQLAMLTLLPQIILSGFVFPLEAMPWGIRWIAYLMPLTYFIPVSRAIFLKGLTPWDFPLEMILMTGFACFFILLAAVRFRRSLS